MGLSKPYIDYSRNNFFGKRNGRSRFLCGRFQNITSTVPERIRQMSTCLSKRLLQITHSTPFTQNQYLVFVFVILTDTCSNINNFCFRPYKICNNEKCILAFNNCQSNSKEIVYDSQQYTTKHQAVERERIYWQSGFRYFANAALG